MPVVRGCGSSGGNYDHLERIWTGTDDGGMADVSGTDRLFLAGVLGHWWFLCSSGNGNEKRGRNHRGRIGDFTVYASIGFQLCKCRSGKFLSGKIFSDLSDVCPGGLGEPSEGSFVGVSLATLAVTVTVAAVIFDRMELK